MGFDGLMEGRNGTKWVAAGFMFVRLEDAHNETLVRNRLLLFREPLFHEAAEVALSELVLEVAHVLLLGGLALDLHRARTPSEKCQRCRADPIRHQQRLERHTWCFSCAAAWSLLSSSFRSETSFSRSPR